MSDPHAEQLLNELLGQVARADRELRAPAGLEARVMGSWNPSLPSNRRSTALVTVAIAAALVAAVAVSLRHHEAARSSEIRPPVVVTMDAPRVEPPAELSSQQSPIEMPRVRRHPARPPRVTEEVVDFIPLGPMTPVDVSGSFQIVPVRINNAPARLLLGEDGTAQGILWRSR